MGNTTNHIRKQGEKGRDTNEDHQMKNREQKTRKGDKRGSGKWRRFANMGWIA